MSAIARIARAQYAQAQAGGPTVNIEPWIEAFRNNGSETAAGKTVTVPSAFGVAAVWAAIRVLSDTVGTLPLITYRRVGDDQRERVPTRRTYRLLHDQPNPEMAASTMWRLSTTWLNSWGNAFLGKTFAGAEVVELWPIRPDRVTVERRKGQKVFLVKDEGGRELDKVFTQREIVHMFGLSLDGMVGLSPIAYARESIGSALAMDEWTNSFFSRGALPRLALLSKKQLSDHAKTRVREGWERLYGGSRRANRVAVLEEDMTIHTISLPQKDLEFVNQRKWSVQEAARWFRVPVSLIEGDKGGSLTYSTVEGDNLHFATHSVRPWLHAIEDELNRDADLFPSGRYFCEFLLDELLRADTLARYQGYQIATNPVSGWMKPSEVRARENLPPDPDFDLPRPAAYELAAPPDSHQEPVPARGGDRRR